MALDDEYSFKKGGSIPFKWEIQPGVPKFSQSQKHPQYAKEEEFSFSETPKILALPPAVYYYSQPPISARTGSFRSAPRSRSDRFRLQPVRVSTTGCFPSPKVLSRNYNEKKHNKTKKPKAKSEMDSDSDLETLSSSRLSVSSRKSLPSPFRDSPSSSSFSLSYRSTPTQLVNQDDWAGFGLF